MDLCVFQMNETPISLFEASRLFERFLKENGQRLTLERGVVLFFIGQFCSSPFSIAELIQVFRTARAES